ncbi:anti-sigma factor family protein [Actinopolymorpha pittospori]
MTASSHVDDDVLADAHAGLLSEAEAAQIEAHLANCAECAAADQALTDLEDLLRDAGATPLPMPAAVADRLEATLQNESLARSRETGVASLATARHRDHVRSGRLRPRHILAAAASVAVLAAGGIAAVSLVDREGTPVAEGPSTTRSATATPGPSPTTAGNYAFKPDAGRTDVSEAGFAAAVGGMVTAAPAGTGKNLRPNGSTGIAGNPNVCIARLLNNKDAGNVLDTVPGKFEGSAVILVLTAARGGSDLHVYAVAGCSGGQGRIVQDAPISTR